MEIFHCFYFGVLLAFTCMVAVVLAVDPYSEALLSLKSELTDDDNSLDDWLVPPGGNTEEKVQACSWSGVKCDRNSTVVIALDLSMKKLGGELTGKQFGVFAELVDLNLSYNSFSGQLPVGIFNLTNLKSFDISRNNFSGQFPDGMSSLRNLVVLDAFSNSFSGPLPIEVSELEYLKVFNLAGSYFAGPIPSEYGSFKSLEFIHLAGNSLDGNIPPELGRLKTVTHMEIGYNSYEGELKNLKLLSLMYNEMNGTVPPGIGQLPSLETLLIWNNFFSGSLPQDLGKSLKLKWVDVSTNNFIGSIPPDICAGGLAVSHHPSPIALRLCVYELKIIPSPVRFPLIFSHLPDITYVDLSRNKFTGGIPTDISQASRLQYFNISNNPGLGGMIPANTWSLPLLQNFSASACNISGNLPPFHSCKSVSVIELSVNKLSGSFPRDVSNCQALGKIDLADNKLTGHIPEDLASLPALSILDLSRDNFSGPIPAKFGASSSLVVLNVSFNDISGSIPSSNVFKLMGTSAYQGNPKLCGAPLGPCSASITIFGSKGTRKLTWILLLCAAVVVLIVASAFGIFYIRRGSKGRWKMVSFSGLPRFTASDVLRSFSSSESVEAVPPESNSVCKAVPAESNSVCKAVLPTGITVSVKKIELEAKTMKKATEFMTRLGVARHKNLIRLLGFCYNKQLAYVLYDYQPNGNLAEKITLKRDWVAKYKLVIGIARGLCFLHHDCYPAIPHGDLKLSNILFDENMEPHLAEFGFKYLVEMTKGSSPATIFMGETGELSSSIKEELYMDIYRFGEITLQILTNLANAGGTIHSKPKEVLLREIYSENQTGSTGSTQEEIKMVLEVALLCVRSRPSDRPSMEDALKLLSGMKSQRK
ncbi:LEUCINE-RICH REPEAT RECEPTOR-LIKE PROTEIN KINASE [Salix purpurea]|uniref:LEUCINE-RICH REPEAT RECEPTOR-LIKE PROTEIN KINASE n=1 Tax=Salix purpurea TaxID=77065 RepID=A0A9Q0ZEP5_SALPP|nr:LEUCINE-RICH REPEAT RECEPTOR-LIKE PROTEIN KINASE [Salix purpurea]